MVAAGAYSNRDYISATAERTGSPRAAMPSRLPRPKTHASIAPVIATPWEREEKMPSSVRRIFVALLLAAAVAAPLGPVVAGEVREFTVVVVDYQGTKLWLPATLVVHKGDRVRIHLVNNVPSRTGGHGFSIPAYSITEVVERGKAKTVEFTADRAGIFPFSCHLHPAHVGGEIVVLD